MANIAYLGTGLLGAALAEAAAKRGDSVTAWNRSPDKAQHVELTFTPVGDGTEVRLVHSGWEALAERAAATREEYERGWNVVFVERYGDFARAETAR